MTHHYQENTLLWSQVIKVHLLRLTWSMVLFKYKVIQRRNIVFIFNVEFHNVGKRRNNVVKMTISKKNNKKNISNRIHGIQSF